MSWGSVDLEGGQSGVLSRGACVRSCPVTRERERGTDRHNYAIIMTVHGSTLVAPLLYAYAQLNHTHT